MKFQFFKYKIQLLMKFGRSLKILKAGRTSRKYFVRKKGNIFFNTFFYETSHFSLISNLFHHVFFFIL